MKRNTAIRIGAESEKETAKQRISLLIMMSHSRLQTGQIAPQYVEKKAYSELAEREKGIDYAMGYANSCPNYCRLCDRRPTNSNRPA